MSNEAWLVIALAAVVGGLSGYVGYLVARRRRLAERLEEISQEPPR